LGQLLNIEPVIHMPNPDKPELATKTLRHKEKKFIKNFVPWCLGGEYLLFDKSFASMMWFQ